MKIYYIGSHSSGKSTLARYTSEKYNLPMLTEVARMVLSQNELNVDSLRSDIKIVNSYQAEVFNRQLLEESKLIDFVADRSLLDSVAYSAQHSTITNELIKRPEFEEYINSLKDAIIFFVRPSKATLKNDGVREQLNWDAVVSIDAMLKLLLEMYSIKYYQINTDSMQERIRLIDAVLIS
jgi:nicotinamide riboside kinase